MHALLGHTIAVKGLERPIHIGLLRADRDLGVGGPLAGAYFLIKLSTRSMVRELESREDFDEAVLAGEKEP